MPSLTEQDIQYNTELLLQASGNGDTDEVKRLIPISDPQSRDSHALRLAAETGHLDVVKLLLPVSNPDIVDVYALPWAAYNGHTDIVQFFIPVSNPKTQNNRALRWAAEEGHIECVKLLIPVSNYQDALEIFIHHSNPQTTLLQQCIEEYEAIQQKDRLDIALNTIEMSSVQHKRKI